MLACAKVQVYQLILPDVLPEYDQSIKVVVKKQNYTLQI